MSAPQGRRLRAFVVVHGFAVATIFAAATVVGAQCGQPPDDPSSLRAIAPASAPVSSVASERPIGPVASSARPIGSDSPPPWMHTTDLRPPWLER